MANTLYAKAKQKTLGALVNWETATISAALVNNGYVIDVLNHEFYSTLSANVVGTPVALTAKTIANGVFDAADVTFPTVAAGSTCNAVVLYIDTGNPATSSLLAYIDVITGFPLATTGGDVVVQWDSGAFKIFSL